MKSWLQKQAARALRSILPPEPIRQSAPILSPEAVAQITKWGNPEWQSYRERCHELIEARQLCGAGPWLPQEARDRIDRPGKFREAIGLTQGSTGDLDLMLANVEWSREVNLSWLEFSRWGIQQIILQSRLFYIKHPWIRRGVNLSAAYVFGQGVELSSPDPDANEVLKEFRERNKAALGQIALCAQERSKSTDGNLFWACFADKESSGQCSVRNIDATEVQDIITNPDDSTEEWYFRRVWTNRIFNPATGETSTQRDEAWYPALHYEPGLQVEFINGIPVQWASPIYHRKCGGIASWLFGCPRVYPALDWSREGRKFLEAYASVWQALRQIAITITTKGGQQALEGVKQQMGTTVGPFSNLLDQNPPAVAGATFASGPGTVLSAFKTTGAGGDPSEIKEFRNMVACVLEIPPTWLGDMETSNLSTAKTLDRPTELGFLLKQEEWQEDLVVLGKWALKVSAGATSGKLTEAGKSRATIREAGRKMLDCHWVYEAKEKPEDGEIEVLCSFPAIREGDIVEDVTAIVRAMTLDNKAGQVIGVDEKAATLKLSKLIDLPNPDELVEEMFPEDDYEPNRAKRPIPAPIAKPRSFPGGIQPTPGQAPDERGQPTPGTTPGVEAALRKVGAAIAVMEASNGKHG